MRVSLLILALLAGVLLSCNSPTDNVEEEKDPRISKLYQLFSLPGGLVTLGTDSPHLWEGEDEADFTFYGGFLNCLNTSTSEKISWHLFEPPEPETGMVYIRASGSVTIEATCELVGQNSILFRYPSTGEEITANVREGPNACWYLDKVLPSEGTLRTGIVDGDEIPDYVSLPEPMPVGTFRELFCDVSW